MFLIKFLLTTAILVCSANSHNDKPISEYISRFTYLAGDVFLNASKSKNVVFSPMNIFHSFSLFHLGSINETRKELANIFGFPENPENDTAYHTKFGDTLRSLQASENMRINPSASIFAHYDLKLNSTFVERAKEIYDANIKNVNFTEIVATTKYINSWISQQTSEHIPNFFKEPLDSDIRFVLVSAIYFNADWQFGFDKNETKIDDFNTGLSTLKVDMMSQNRELEYLDNPKYPFRILGLPYKNNDFYFYIQLPREEPTSANFTCSFEAVYLASVEALPLLAHELIHVRLPRLSIRFESDLRTVLKKMGSEHILESPQLDGIFDEQAPDGAEAKHGATIDLDEAGTVATAVTSFAISFRSFDSEPKPVPIEFLVNKPFTFFIYHKPLKTILFAGAVSSV